ncbi:4-hydroxy-tetrahydrodipicolinate reductase [Sinorhizobium meliloti]|nr:4-hydroxy-tetrahydrodipicolinate reductase [Sinorhizobium meliloti]
MSQMRLVVVGAAGRMGRMLIKAIAENPGCTLSGAIERPGSAAVGQDAGVVAGMSSCGVLVTSETGSAFADADGVLDFTTPEATVEYSSLAARAGIVHIVGTTGMEAVHFSKLERAARTIPIVQSGNMSLGVNILADLVRKVAATLDNEWDIEVLEMHHRMKVDAPSGAALLLGEAASSGRQTILSDHYVAGRDGYTGCRTVGTIGFAALRGGTVVGDHKVVFAGAGERIELSHIAEDRSLFARGAIKAALWGRNREHGLYTMSDVLGLDGL